MSPEDKHIREVISLTLLSLETEISEAEFKRLQGILLTSPAARDTYFRLLNVHLGVQEPDNLKVLHSKTQAIEDPVLLEAVAEIKKQPVCIDPELVNRIRARADRQLQAFLTEQERLRQVQTQSERNQINLWVSLLQWVHTTQTLFTTTWKVTKRLGIAAVIVLAMLMALQAYRMNRVVAFVGEQVHASWMDVMDSNTLRPGLLALEKGFAQVHFKRGAEVLVQAPCEFKLLTPNRMRLLSGRVSAKVPPEASGFRIDTEEGAIVDYGTEFGVGLSRQLDVHVFVGEVQLDAYADGKRRATSQSLVAGQAVALRPGRIPVLGDVAEQTALFSREIPDPNSTFGIPGERIDLADIVGGGNGFGSGRREAGIELMTGQTTTYLTYGNRVGTPGFRAVSSLVYVDGVFLPEGSQGSIQVNSQGLLWEDCPITSSMYWTQLSNSRFISAWEKRIARLGGVRYGTSQQPLILLVPNAGITFDLERLRDHLPGYAITGFTSTLGVADNALSTPGEASEADADMWVLIDGKTRFMAEGVTVGQDPIAVELEIQPYERWLTLVVTDHDQNINYDVAMFGEPALVLSPQ